MRIVPAVGSLRRRKMYKAMRDATVTAALRERFRIVQLSIQRTHVHMLVEAEHKDALARGMQGFQILPVLPEDRACVRAHARLDYGD